ncbi:MAG: VapC toxin family PIN domain ribonuclease [Luteolibacter sp.]
MTAWLLDGNVLIAMAVAGHPHHQRIRRWRQATQDDTIATCPVTEGTLLRLHMQTALDKSAAAAWAALASIHAHPKHVFWPENFSYSEISPTRLTGHRQLTDAWLVELARRKGGKLATLDEPLAALWPEVAVLVPV